MKRWMSLQVKRSRRRKGGRYYGNPLNAAWGHSTGFGTVYHLFDQYSQLKSMGAFDQEAEEGPAGPAPRLTREQLADRAEAIRLRKEWGLDVDE